MFQRFVTLGLGRSLFIASPKFRLRPIQWSRSNRFQFIKRLQSTSAKQTPPKKGIKALMQEYGYSALAVYLLLSCIDFPICFVFVHQVGVDRVREYQDDVKNTVKEWLGWEGKEKNAGPTETESAPDTNQESKSFWKNPLVIEAIVAYALHKSLVFVRVPITAAVTPKFVSQLRKWGFKIGNQKLRTIAQQAKAKTTDAVISKAQAANISKNFGTSPSKRQKWWSWFF